MYAFDAEPKLFEDVRGIDERLVYFKKGIEIAETLGNEDLLLKAYRRNLMIASTNGYFEVSRYYASDKLKPIVLKNHNRFEEGNVNNDLGYNACATERYQLSNDYFNEALSIFCELNEIDYVGETLYNMSINAIMAEDYEFANTCLLAVINILEIFHSESIRVAHVSKIFGLRAFCAFRRGIIYECQMCVNSVYQFLEHVIDNSDSESRYTYWDDDLFLFHLCTGLLACEEGNYGKAEQEYKRAFIFGGPSKGGGAFYYSIYAEEMAKLYRLLGREAEAQKVLKDCIAYYDEKDYMLKQKKLIAMLNQEEYHNEQYHFKFYGATLENVYQLIEDNKIQWEMDAYHKKVNYLSAWQKLINTEFKSAEDLIMNASLSLKNEFNLDALLFVKIEDDKPVVKYSDAKVKMNAKKLKQFVSYFNEKRTDFTVSKLDKNYFEYEIITSLFEERKICAILGVPMFVNEQLNAFCIAYILMNDNWGAAANSIVIEKSELPIFKLLFRQLLDAEERLEAQQKIQKINKELKGLNERLKYFAISDQLTGIYNRKGFSDIIDEHIAKAVKEEASLELTIIYCDLDKFKYYNDTFGHEVGDVLLVEFAHLIQKICKNQGYAIRYGGDEFVLMLNHANKKKAERAAKAIYGAIEKSNSFLKQVEKIVGDTVEISPENRLSSSIGITFVTGEPSKEVVEDAIKRADDTLYYIKRTGKRRYEFWEDVKDEI